MDRREALRVLAYSGGSLASLGAMSTLLAGCGKLRPPQPVRAPDRYGVTILVDGLRADTFRTMLDAGALPNIQRHLVDRGTLVENCIGTLPSTSGPAHLAIVNGRMPGTNNCPGIRWIDRMHNEVRDYCTLETIFFNTDFPPENYTLYEMLGSQRTVCIFDFVSRGAGQFHRPSLETLWFIRQDRTEPWQDFDREAVDVFDRVYEEEPLPAFTFVWMPAIDHLSHLHGSTSDLVWEQATIVDGQVGRIVEILQKQGIFEKTLVSLTADHGLRDTESNMDIRRPLRERGFDVLRDLAGNDEFNALYSHNAARAVSGNGFALLYFAKKKKRRWATWMGWEDKPSLEELRDFPSTGGERVDLIDTLRNEPAVKFTMALEQDDATYRTYRLFTKDGDARIERDESSRKLRYAVLNGPDPLGYAGNSTSNLLMDGGFHDKNRWFEHTVSTDYPDAVFQISQLFDSERCGDLVTSSAPGWDFMDQGHRATHGGLERDEIMVPCVVAGPGIREGDTIPWGRTVDLYPMYLEFFRIPNLDGEVPNVFR